MAHNLNQKDGKTSLMVVGESAWHNLGTVLENAVTAEQAIKLGGLDYEVEKRTITAEGVNRPLREMATVRTDTNQYLGIVGRNYQVIQNSEAFVFFDTLVERDEAVYHSAGVLGDGEKVWVQAKMPEYIKVGKDDITEMYVTLTNSHDGWGALKAYITPIRVVCENTLRLSLGNTKGMVSIRHTKNFEDRLKDASRVLEISKRYTLEIEDAFNELNRIKVSKTTVEDFLAWAFPSEKAGEEVHTRTKNNRLELLSVIETGKGQEVAKTGTGWWLFNGYTRYLENKGITNKSWEVDALLDGSIHSLRQSAYAYITR